MYQEIILDHYRHPHHRGLREPYDAEVHHINPTCGDEVTLRVRLSRAEDGPAGDMANGAGSAADDAVNGTDGTGSAVNGTDGAVNGTDGTGSAVNGARGAGSAGSAADDAAESAANTANGDVRVSDVSYDALGCSISQASASVMTDLVIGKTVDEALAVGDAFLALMQARGDAAPDEDTLEDAVAFAGVAKYPARVKCALLGWMAWKDATIRALDGKAGHAS
jgi:SUF system NifU family Fe-S assembly protein